jgi:hypothetical protein
VKFTVYKKKNDTKVTLMFQVVEYGRPKDLMASHSSKFKAMLDAVEKQQEDL